MMSDGSDFPDDSINLFDYGLGMKEISPINSSYSIPKLKTYRQEVPSNGSEK